MRRQEAANTTWAYGKPEPNPYEMEWVDLIAAIREDRPYNEVERGAEASLQAVSGSHGGPYRPENHAQRIAPVQARVRARCR